MPIEKNISEQIIDYTKYLKLPATRLCFTEVAIEAARANMSYEEYLKVILEKEYEKRIHNRKLARIRTAAFPYKKYLEDLVVENLSPDAQSKLKTLQTLSFINEGQNVILAGNPGTGKTHIAIGLGIKACLAGYKVLFTSIPSLVTHLKENRSSGNLLRLEKQFEKYDLIICDELGYISFDKEGAELLFTNLSLRVGRKATIVTTNLPFNRWNEIFHDPVLTAAMVDRLTHKAHLVNMVGKSYRIKETKEWMSKKKG